MHLEVNNIRESFAQSKPQLQLVQDKSIATTLTL